MNVWGSTLRASSTHLSGKAKTSERNLVPQQPHGPTGHDNATDEHHEAIKPVADLLLRAFALSDAEDNGRKNGEQDCRRKMGKRQVHFFLPMAIW